jgi:hypothetical protein
MHMQETLTVAVCGAKYNWVQGQNLTWQVACCVVFMGVMQLTLVVNVAPALLLHVRVTRLMVTNWPRGTALGCTAVLGSKLPAATCLKGHALLRLCALACLRTSMDAPEATLHRNIKRMCIYEAP